MAFLLRKSLVGAENAALISHLESKFPKRANRELIPGIREQDAAKQGRPSERNPGKIP
jgi:hypothetical protein